MRAGFVISVLTVALLVLAAVAIVSRTRPLPKDRAAVPSATNETVAASRSPQFNAIAIDSNPPATSVADGCTNTTDVNALSEEAIAERVSQFNELAMLDDPAAHQQIVKELKNANPEIRKAALAALEQADDRSVIPEMKEIAATASDFQEKQEILSAVEFIELPSPTGASNPPN